MLIKILQTDQIHFRARNESQPSGLNVRNDEITKDKRRLRDYKSHTKETHAQKKPNQKYIIQRPLCKHWCSCRSTGFGHLKKVPMVTAGCRLMLIETI